MPPLARPQSQEMPTPEFLAHEAKDLLVYAAQEGTPQDVKVFYEGLDVEKVLALIAIESQDPSELPIEVVNQLLGDTREVVRKALKEHPAFFQRTHFFTVKEWVEAHGLSQEEIVENGRKSVAHVIARASSKELRKDEVEGIRMMARNIPDERVVEMMLPLAERYPAIALELAYNPGLTESQVNRLVDITMPKLHEDSKWVSVIMQMIANPENHARISPSSFSKMESDPQSRGYLEIWNQAGRDLGKVIELPRPSKKERKSIEQRRMDRQAKRSANHPKIQIPEGYSEEATA
jgi:hypothetical protein